MGAASSSAIGSVCGLAVQSQTILGLSTASGSGILTLSSATCGVGAVVIIAYCYYNRDRIWNYLRKNKNNDIQQLSSRQRLSNEQLNPDNNGPNIPKWTKILMKQEQFDQLTAMTQESFRQKMQKLICPITHQVMRKPCLMACCKDLVDKTNRWAEQSVLRSQINRNGRCVLCHSPAQTSYIKFDENLQIFIIGFRQKLLKTYVKLPPESRPYWKDLIDGNFGEGYTEKHLENFTLVKH